MKFTPAWLVLLVCAFLIPGIGRATHIVGGEIIYEDLGSGNYRITLTVYRDCGPANTNGTPFDDNASVGIFRADGTMEENLMLSLTDADVDYLPVELENPCFVLPPDLCVERAVYSDIVNLPPIVGGYDLVYQRCCRNPSIINIVSPQDMGATFTTQIPGTELTTEANSCPHFVNYPPVALCTNAAFWFDHSAVDEDGDSLTYEFCTPMHGGDPAFPMPQPPNSPPFTYITWDTGFSESYPITSNPPFTIDPATGWLTGTPTQPGQFVIGICVNEYRDGILLSHTNRDFQFNVTICDPNIIAAIPEQTSFCEGLDVSFQNNSINANFFHWDFGVAGTDSDTSNAVNPSFTFPENGEYTITLIANPGWPCADTAYSTWAALPVIEPQINFTGYECINNVMYYDFTSTANVSANAIYDWQFGAGSVPQSSSEANPQNVMLSDDFGSIFNISLSVSDNGCEESDTETVENPPEPVSEIVPQDSFCDGYTYQFENNSTNATDYLWDFGWSDSSADWSYIEEPLHTFPDTGHFQVMLVAISDLTCPDTSWFNFEIYGLLDPSFPAQGPQCFEGNSFDFTGLGATTDQADYSWTFGASSNPPTSVQQNPQNVEYITPGTYDVELTISENGCTESYSDNVQILANPVIGFDLEHAEGCPDLYVQFNDTSFAETQLFYHWYFGDGIESTQDDPTHPYTTPGTYDVTLNVFTVNGCVQDLWTTLQDAIVVYPEPMADFDVNPSTVSILEPEVSIIDQSIGSNSCIFYFGDGGMVDDCNFNYSFTESGRIEVTQYVTNQYGCVDHITKYVNVEGFLFYAPNAFTPNEDGVNDFWMPQVTGASEYELKIWNRWGENIFVSTDPKEPWTGNVHGGDYFAQDGVYTYTVVIHDLLGYPHDFVGHLTLTR